MSKVPSWDTVKDAPGPWAEFPADKAYRLWLFAQSQSCQLLNLEQIYAQSLLDRVQEFLKQALFTGLKWDARFMEEVAAEIRRASGVVVQYQYLDGHLNGAVLSYKHWRRELGPVRPCEPAAALA